MFNLFFSAFLFGLNLSTERLPNPLSNDVYDLLYKHLTTGEIIKLSKNSDLEVLTKKVYRLVKSKKYSVVDLENPITGIQENIIVSKT